MLGNKISVQTFRVYLLGKPFTIETDHRYLERLDCMKESNSQLSRWSLFLQPYQYQVVYRPGHKNGNADALSRGTYCGQTSLLQENGKEM